MSAYFEVDQELLFWKVLKMLLYERKMCGPQHHTYTTNSNKANSVLFCGNALRRRHWHQEIIEYTTKDSLFRIWKRPRAVYNLINGPFHVLFLLFLSILFISHTCLIPHVLKDGLCFKWLKTPDGLSVTTILIILYLNAAELVIESFLMWTTKWFLIAGCKWSFCTARRSHPKPGKSLARWPFWRLMDIRP